MNDTPWRCERARAVFAGAGLARLEDLADCRRGELVTTARTRWLRRFELGGTVWYLKVQDLRRTRPRLHKWPGYLARGLPVWREARSLDRLRRLGVRTPEVAAAGQLRLLWRPRLAVLLTAEVPGHVDLVTFLRAEPSAAAARAAMDAAEALVASLHDLGLVLLGAKYRNLLVPRAGTGDPAAIVVLDQPDLRASCSRRLRTKDRALLALDRARHGGGC